MFDMGGNDAAIDAIVAWLHAREVRHAVVSSFAFYGEPDVWSILLPLENDFEAVYLSLWPGCVGVRRCITGSHQLL